MARRYRARVAGPLREFAEGFRAELAGQGYVWVSAEAQVGLMGHLSGWLTSQALSVGDLTEDAAARYLADRRRVRRQFRSLRALAPLLGYLRVLGVAPAPAVVVAGTPAARVAERFAGYLSRERGLAPATVRSYVDQVRPFLAEHVDGEGRCAQLTAGEVMAFVTRRAVGQRPRSVQVGVNALRALLRWMWRERLTPASQGEVLGPVAAPALVGLPKALTSDELAAVLVALPAEGPVRVRDEAMLALMWRLGLRAGEVARLRLDDVDWRVGVLVVRGKGDRCEQLPLPVDVGRLLVAYLRRARPPGLSYREVLVAIDAPHRPLTPWALSTVASRAFARAGISGPGGAHRLRHTAACRVLATGGGLAEAGQLLRHASTAATAIYAKTDLAGLAVLARPWPVEVPR
jgi:integrase/recombinase XerD